MASILKFFYIFLILIKINLIITHNYLLQNCNINHRNHIRNRCESISEIFIEKNLNSFNSINFWCIIIDNRHDFYTNNLLIIKVTRGFRINWSGSDKLSNNGLEIKFRLSFGINRFVIQSYTENDELPELKSIKINNHELCEKRIIGEISVSPEPLISDDDNNNNNNDYDNFDNNDDESSNDNHDYRFLKDCLKRKIKTNPRQWCPNLFIGSDILTIEKYSLSNKNYWCGIFEKNENFENVSISFSDPNKFLTWVSY